MIVAFAFFHGALVALLHLRWLGHDLGRLQMRRTVGSSWLRGAMPRLLVCASLLSLAAWAKSPLALPLALFGYATARSATIGRVVSAGWLWRSLRG